MLLEAEHHEVFAVSDGREAVARAREIAPDLILMDLSLPILSGWEATRLIRADPATASIPVLAVTAHAMQGDRERALAAGCDGFIPKPINEETFAARVASYLGGQPSSRAPGPARGDELPGGGPGRILVVDDQPDVARLLQEDLQADGHEVVAATSAAQALRDFESDGRFDLCVIDVMLGAESGYALTQTLSQRSTEFVPVLLLTAGTIDREKGFDVGADDFIGKPIETVELRARARSLIRVGRLVREQRRLGRERSEAYRKLSELDRMRSDFLSTVSHELRTPLNTIVLLAHQLNRASPTPEEEGRKTRNVHVLLEAAEALRRMIDNMLDLAKLEAGQRDLHPQSVSVRELLRENADLVEPQALEKGLDLVIEAHPDLPAVSSFDREKLSRVLVNLLSNAVKYTNTGSVTLSAQPWQGSTTFEVRDTGRGIPAEMIGAAFEPFRQIRPRTGDSQRGTGLGLTISKQLVEIMGGDLILESKEGAGTRVRFTIPDLPVTLEEVARGTDAAVALPPSMRGQSLVLIVEDDHASRYGLGALLESEGYRVQEAANLKEANARLEDSSPGAIVLDITLPDGDGAVWLRERLGRDQGRLPPVIALTGITADADTRRIENAGAWKVLTKPVNVGRLLGALRDALSGSQPA